MRDPRLKYLFLFYADGGRVYKLDGTGLRTGEHSFDDISECFAFAYAYPPRPDARMGAWLCGVSGVSRSLSPRGRARGRVGAMGFHPRTERIPLRRQYQWHPRRPAIPQGPGRADALQPTPIFLSDSAHRYNTFDYYQIDPLLGHAGRFQSTVRRGTRPGYPYHARWRVQPLRYRLSAFQRRAGKGASTANTATGSFLMIWSRSGIAHSATSAICQAQPAKCRLRGVLP